MLVHDRMHQWYFVPLLVAIAALLAGCGGAPSGGCEVTGSGSKETKTIKLGSYRKLEVDDGIAVTVSVGTEESFTITAYSNVIDYVDAGVDRRDVFIKMKKGACNHGASATIVEKSESAFQTVEAAGGSTLTIEQLGNAPSGNVYVEATGGSSVTVAGGRAKRAQIDAKDGSTVMLGSLSASKGWIDVSGGSSVSGMHAEDMDVSVQGGSKLNITTKAASGSCTGGGSVILRGCAPGSVQASGGCKVTTPSAALLQQVSEAEGWRAEVSVQTPTAFMLRAHRAEVSVRNRIRTNLTSK